MCSVRKKITFSTYLISHTVNGLYYTILEKYAYIKLNEDDVYNEFSNLVNAVFEERNKAVPKNLINDILGIACDENLKPLLQSLPSL